MNSKLKALFLLPMFWVVCFYLISHLIFLGLIPVFNDEAIYLDWGWRAVHFPGLLYFSLFDGKQPLLMWVFGIAQYFVPVPLLAGRLVSVLTGLCTLIGLNLLTKRYFPQLKSWQVVLLYSLIPIFVFFDRQALMESAVSASGVWSCYLTLRFIEKPGVKFASLLGLVLGIGLFIKSTPIIFGLESLTLILLSRKHFTSEEFQKVLVYFSIAITICFIVVFPLFVQPSFMNIVILNSRFSLSFRELLSFPVLEWLKHALSTSELILVYMTPLVLASTLFSFKAIWLKGNRFQKMIAIWLLLGLGIFILTVKLPSPRYIVAFLPIISLLAIDRIKSFSSLIAVLCLPLLISILLIFKPLQYFQLLSHLSHFSQQTEYVSDWTSGYGVKEVCSYLSQQAEQQNITVFIRLDSGNPENSIMSCFQSSERVQVNYLPPKFTLLELKQALCENENLHPYFVSRDLQYAGMESVLIEKEKYMKPIGDKFVGVYQFKSCEEMKSL